MAVAVKVSASWTGLERELDAWADAGLTATLWWRDDDACRATPALERLLATAAGGGAADATPLALAVIPLAAEPELASLVAVGPEVAVLQHGYAHQNHAGPKEKKMELGPHRPFEQTIADIAAGWQRLESLFGARLLPVMTPPWNRIAPRLAAMLPGIGFSGLSAFGPRQAAEPWPGLRQINTHVDIIDWKGTRGFAGAPSALAAAAGHLAARRAGRADAAEPTGLLTHHLVHDEGCWAFVAEFLARTAAHPAVRWISAREGFADGAAT